MGIPLRHSSQNTWQDKISLAGSDAGVKGEGQVSGESPIRPRLGNLNDLSCEPTDALRLPRVELGNVRFDIQQRGAVHDVHVFHGKARALNPEESHHRDADGVGPPRCPGSEDSMQLIVQKRRNEERVALRQVEMVDEENMREPFQVLETIGECGVYLDGSLDTLGTC
jgi:hypothetical protein